MERKTVKSKIEYKLSKQVKTSATKLRKKENVGNQKFESRCNCSFVCDICNQSI